MTRGLTRPGLLVADAEALGRAGTQVVVDRRRPSRGAASSAGRSAGSFRSTAIARLPAWAPRNGRVDPAQRVAGDGSSLMTSAPRSASRRERVRARRSRRRGRAIRSPSSSGPSASGGPAGAGGPTGSPRSVSRRAPRRCAGRWRGRPTAPPPGGRGTSPPVRPARPDRARGRRPRRPSGCATTCGSSKTSPWRRMRDGADVGVRAAASSQIAARLRREDARGAR